MEKARQVLAHVRVSGKPQVDRTGIPRQFEDIAALCKQHNLKVVGEPYRFDGLSGASVENDPKYRAMLARLGEPEIAGLVFSSIDRLFRPEYLDQYSILKVFRVHNKLMFCDMGELDVRREQDQWTVQTAAQGAAMQRRRISEWTRRGREIRRKQGNCKTDPLPAGVCFVPDEKQIPTELPTGHFKYWPPAEADRVRDAFNRILAGQTMATVARELRYSGHSSLRKVLRSRWWVGEKSTLNFRIGGGLREDGSMFYGKRVARPEPIIAKTNLAEKPLVSREDFAKVQAILDTQHKTWTSKASRTSEFLGLGLVHCECGHKLYGKISTGRGHGDGTRFYHCASNYRKSADGMKLGCGRGIYHKDVVDTSIERWMLDRLTDTGYVPTIAPAAAQVDTAAIQKQIETASRKRSKLLALVADLDETETKAVMAQVKELRGEIADLQKQLQAKPAAGSVDAGKWVKTFKAEIAPFKTTQKYSKVVYLVGKESLRDVLMRHFSAIQLDAAGKVIGATLR